MLHAAEERSCIFFNQITSRRTAFMKNFSFFFLFFTCLIFHGPELSHAAAIEVQLTASDGHRIYGTFSKSEKVQADMGAVLLHMYRQTKESWDPLIPVLHDHGIHTLAIDMRGHGRSRFGPKGKDLERAVISRDPAIFNTMYRDALAAIDYLHKQKGIAQHKIALIGASVGCSVAIHTATVIHPPLGALVVMTPGKNYLGIPTMEHLRNWPAHLPLLILSSEEEAERGATALAQSLQGKGAELVLFEESDIHGTQMFGEVDGLETRLAGWLKDKLSVQ